MPPSGTRNSKEATKFGRRGGFGPTSVHKPGLLPFFAQDVRTSPRRAFTRLSSLCYCANPKFPLCFSQGAASSVNTLVTLQASLLCSITFSAKSETPLRNHTVQSRLNQLCHHFTSHVGRTMDSVLPKSRSLPTPTFQILTSIVPASYNI